ncbi:caspase family protein [Methylobacterium nonmethylotrophicum]|uniref:Peptidase C14 n=1 Tax=Methylobacterium nonmethylotrophicum TaxID=1141884 RepID=A0A4Z0NKJ8_9HYPH|nr:caspase domain-containing protein [Methylobacterium nonmethylotrophicum]TGD96741.1 peptidase C14 [Methylobacterium nonmethylotrophicum]
MPPLRHLALVLAALAGLVVSALPSRAAPAERRIALVVGNGAYAGGPIPTAANDAGLVAQTLQAAGFDVVGARDLDEESLRRALRDFTDKAAAAGADAVAFVYLAGYGLQLENEAYFAPVDARIATASDVPLQALRVSDYVKRLAALPLKARFVVLDAARTAPFRLTGDPLAGGLPLVEAEPGSLIATNAAPGTVGPAETGPYGAYALALVEMIREGGLVPAALFERVRLRVAEVTRGAAVPWSASRIAAPFVFLEREAGAPSLAGFEPPARPLGEIGAREAYAACLARDTLPAYEEFVAAYPRDPLARRVRAIIAARREALTWRRSALANTPEAYWSYLARYPRGPHAWDARRRLSALAAAVEPPPDYRVLTYDVPPPLPEEVVYVERPALLLDDPAYALPPPPVAFLPPRPTVLVELAPPPPPVEAYLLPTPVYVPVPPYVVAPPAVVPPPNPALFHNLHARTPDGPEPAGAARLAPVAGAVAGAALGAAASRVALPPALAQKAALRPDPRGAPGQIPRPNGPAGGPVGGPVALRPSLPGQIPAPAGPRAPGPNPGQAVPPGQALPGAGGAPLPAVAGRPGMLPGQPPAGRAPGLGQIPPAAAPPAGPPAAAGRPGQPALAARPPQAPAPAPQGLQPQGVRPPISPLRPTQPPRMAVPAQPPRPAAQAMQPPRMAAPTRAPRPDDGLQRMRMEQAVRQQAMQQQAMQRQQAMQAQQAQARQRFEAQQMMQRQHQEMQDAMRRQQAQAMRQPQMMAPRPQPMQPHPLQVGPRPTPHAPSPGRGCGRPGEPPCR